MLLVKVTSIYGAVDQRARGGFRFFDVFWNRRMVNNGSFSIPVYGQQSGR